MITLSRISKFHPDVQFLMRHHYSRPKGFVGRSLCYMVLYEEDFYGCTVAGSATLHLPGRDEFFGGIDLCNIVNNIFFSIHKVRSKYPISNFVPKVIKTFRERVRIDWKSHYGDDVKGFETLIGLPRTGDCYKRDGWIEVGLTKGYSCKRIAGKGTDNWTGKRVWDTTTRSPKRVLVRHV